MPLKNHIKQALSGNADSLIVFLHGYGADGQDLLGLADVFLIYFELLVCVCCLGATCAFSFLERDVE